MRSGTGTLIVRIDMKDGSAFTSSHGSKEITTAIRTGALVIAHVYGINGLYDGCAILSNTKINESVFVQINGENVVNYKLDQFGEGHATTKIYTFK